MTELKYWTLKQSLYIKTHVVNPKTVVQKLLLVDGHHTGNQSEMITSNSVTPHQFIFREKSGNGSK
jgi:hypothetical protein